MLSGIKDEINLGNRKFIRRRNSAFRKLALADLILEQTSDQTLKKYCILMGKNPNSHTTPRVIHITIYREYTNTC